MASKISVIIVAFFLLTACQGYIVPKYDPLLYPKSYKFYDLSLFWRTAQNDKVVSIDGFVKNTRYAYIRDLELTATLLDEGGKKISEHTSFLLPITMSMDEYAPFSFSLPVTPGSKPEKIKFYYRYFLAERGYGMSPYFYSFTVDLY